MQNSKTKYKDDELMSFQATTAPYKVADNPIQITTVSSSVQVPLQVKTELSSVFKTVLSIYAVTPTLRLVQGLQQGVLARAWSPHYPASLSIQPA